MCVCFSSACDEWTVLPRPGLHRDVNRFGHSAVVSNGWVFLLPVVDSCCHARGHLSRVWKLQHKYWTTELQSCKYPSVHDALFAGTFLTFLDFFLQCPLSFGDTERLSGLSHFPEISQFCCVDCFGTHLFISVLNLVSVYTPPVTSSAEKVVAATSSILPISGCFLSNSFFTPFIYRYSVYMHFITSRDLFIPSPFFWICISVSHSHC